MILLGKIPDLKPENARALLTLAWRYVTADMWKMYLVGLTKVEQDALVLISQLEISNREAARVLGCSHVTIAKRLASAKEKITGRGYQK
jgi:predicted DNA-binding protein (UPF0251 family)